MSPFGQQRRRLRPALAALAGALVLALVPVAGHGQGPERRIVEDAPDGEAPAAPANEQAEEQGAVLQGLDKVTTRISTFEAPVGREVAFGSLRILARTCHKTPPTEPPESAAFLEIDDIAADGARERAFSGWMFASSPALSAMEHPVYDVWVVDCMKSSSSAGDSSG